MSGPTGPSPNVPPPMQGQHPIGPAPMSNAPVAAPPIQHTTPASTGVAAAAVPTPQPQGPSVNSLQVINDMGLASKIDNLAQAGNTPEAIEAGLQSGLTAGQRKWLSDEIRAGQAKPLREMVQDYLTAKPAQQQAAPQPQEIGRAHV